MNSSKKWAPKHCWSVVPWLLSDHFGAKKSPAALDFAAVNHEDNIWNRDAGLCDIGALKTVKGRGVFLGPWLLAIVLPKIILPLFSAKKQMKRRRKKRKKPVWPDSAQSS